MGYCCQGEYQCWECWDNHSRPLLQNLYRLITLPADIWLEMDIMMLCEQLLNWFSVKGDELLQSTSCVMKHGCTFQPQRPKKAAWSGIITVLLCPRKAKHSHLLEKSWLVSYGTWRVLSCGYSGQSQYN